MNEYIYYTIDRMNEYIYYTIDRTRYSFKYENDNTYLYDEEGELWHTVYRILDIADIKDIHRAYLKGVRVGKRVGEIEIQSKIKTLLGL